MHEHMQHTSMWVKGCWPLNLFRRSRSLDPWSQRCPRVPPSSLDITKNRSGSFPAPSSRTMFSCRTLRTSIRFSRERDKSSKRAARRSATMKARHSSSEPFHRFVKNGTWHNSSGHAIRHKKTTQLTERTTTTTYLRSSASSRSSSSLTSSGLCTSFRINFTTTCWSLYTAV